MAEAMKEQLLTLKVMRLARPKFYENMCIPIDSADSTSQLIGSALCRLTGQEAADIPIGKYLMAPQKFELICKPQANVMLYLPQLQEANAVLEPGKCLGEIITHEIKEIGPVLY
uniref:MoeA_C domain-containing protein n=1 Tax=Loa loa TaxID=7209 RepID=A0A1I7VJ54_LOALO